MEIRNSLRENERLHDDIKKKNIQQFFLGNGIGIGLYMRNIKSNYDNHVCYIILFGTSEGWYVPKDGCSSSYWLPELIELTKHAQLWIEVNCFKNRDGYYEFCNIKSDTTHL